MMGKSIIYNVLSLFNFFESRYYIGSNGVMYERIGMKGRIIYIPPQIDSLGNEWAVWWDWPPRYNFRNSGLKEISKNKYKMLIALLKDRP
jgi:hypothetical protein